MALITLGNVGKTPIVNRNTLTPSAPNDLFIFSTTTFGNLNVALTNITADNDADIQLFLDDGDGIFEPTTDDQFIAAGPRPGNQDESINLSTVLAGTYFLEVSRFDLGSAGDISYKLSLSTANPSNLLPIETQLGNLSTDRVFRGNVNNNDTADVYAFSLDTFEGVDIILGDLSANADVRLIADKNKNGRVESNEIIASSTVPGIQNDIIRADQPGNYLLQVYQVDGGSIDYNLTFDYFTNPFSSNLILGEIGATPTVRTDTLSSAEPTDVFTFSTRNVGSFSNINLSLTNISAGDNANLRLFLDDGDGVFEPTTDDLFISTAARNTNVDDSINVANVQTGTLFAEVSRGRGSSGDVSYKLSLSTANPSNLLLNEIPIGNLSKDLSVNANVSNNDTSDIFTFSLDFSEGADILLNPKSGNADFRLIADNNSNGIIDPQEVLLQSTALGSQTDRIRIDDPGNYLLQVYQVSGDPINYSLNFDYFTEMVVL